MQCMTFTTSGGVATCAAPSISISGVTQTDATVSWNAVAGAADYTVEYMISGTQNIIASATTSNTSFPLSNLLDNTSYTVQVRTNCTNGATSSFTSTTFTTGQVCDAIVGGTLAKDSNQPNSTTVVINWEEPVSGLPIAYRVDFVNIGDASDNGSFNVNNPPATINGLTTGAVYEVSVFSICAGNVLSEAISTVFQVDQVNGGTPSGLVPLSVVVNNVFTDGAIIAWNDVPGATSYTLRFRETSATGTPYT